MTFRDMRIQYELIARRWAKKRFIQKSPKMISIEGAIDNGKIL